jgi:hypothetical protein
MTRKRERNERKKHCKDQLTVPFEEKFSKKLY